MSKERYGLGMTAKRKIGNVFVYAVLIIMSIIWLTPFVCIVLQSFRTESTWMVGYVVPKQWGFDNYKKLFSSDFTMWFKTTTILAIACAIIQPLMVLCMSYTLSRFRFALRKPLMKFMLVLTLFPGIVGLLITYRILKDMGLTQENALWGLMIVYCASSGMGYYVSKGYFDTISFSLDESARIDGANRLQVFFKIILPLAKPIVVYTILTSFMGPWGDFMLAKFIAFNVSAGMNVAVGLNSWLTPDRINDCYTMFCAGGVLVAIPVTILFMCFQKYYVEGVTGGSVKG